jgi:hypothetical protein
MTPPIEWFLVVRCGSDTRERRVLFLPLREHRRCELAKLFRFVEHADDASVGKGGGRRFVRVRDAEHDEPVAREIIEERRGRRCVAGVAVREQQQRQALAPDARRCTSARQRTIGRGSINAAAAANAARLSVWLMRDTVSRRRACTRVAHG